MRARWTRMLAAISACAGLAACEPDIAPGSYLCGPEQLCPEGQVCNGPDNVCVFPGAATPFECGASDPAGDTPETGKDLGTFTCFSPDRETTGCLSGGDQADWYQLDVPSECVAVKIQVRMVFPVAFEPLDLWFSNDGAAGTLVEASCANPPDLDLGDQVRCYEQTVAPGGHYAVGVVRSGIENCNGLCAYNRYRLSIRLATP
ncbi:MAG: hypothetical protein ACTHU0_32385 [Kofleriaceae bacterium]